MKFNPDDPKWSAYVLGEMDAAERAALERELESSEEAREFVEDLRMTATIMQDGLREEAAFGLTSKQRETVRAAAQPPKRRFVLPAVWATGAAAASIALGFVLVSTLPNSRQSSIAGLAPAEPAAAVQEPRLKSSAPYAEAEQAAPLADNRADSGLAAPQEDAAVAETVEVLAKLDSAPAQSPGVGAAAGPGAGGGIAAGTAGNGVANIGVVAGSRSEVATGVLGGVLRSQDPVAPVAQGRVSSAFAAERAPASPPAAITAVFDRVAPSPAGNEEYDRITDNGFIAVSRQPLATFSSDVDTASYANVRRFITQNQWPPRDAVRIEELINYFSYAYPQSTGPHPITASLEAAAAPWAPQHRLVRIGVKARDVQMGRRPSNLVFLLDVSGSMNSAEKLPLLKNGLRLLVDKLGEDDTVSIVVYAGASGIALQPTSGQKKEVIQRAIENLQSGGSTNGASGIRLAYDLAVANFIRGGINRVVLATDGDFNVGVTSQGDLLQLIEEKAKSGVFLTVLGFGMGNLKDSTLELLADKGNGHYAYIDSINEARKVLVEEMGSTLVTVAKDVKLQVEFNPAAVSAYRLIGYENRALRTEDFNNDAKDAGDMGAGHTVTALFEVVPQGVNSEAATVDSLRYQRQPAAAPLADAAISNEMLNLKIRYKDPDGTESKLLEMPLLDRRGTFANASPDFRFAAAVAGFGMILRDSPHKGSASLAWVVSTAANSRGRDIHGYREEFIRLAQRAMQIGAR